MSEKKHEMFEFFDVEEEPVKALTGKRGSYSLYVKALKDFVKSGKESSGVRYYGESKKLSSVVATLRKNAKDNKLPVKVELAETEDGGDKVILFSKLRK